jgi:hypothetical protein
MFASINPVKKLRFDRAEEFEADLGASAVKAPPNDSIATILRAFGTSIDDQPRIPMRETDADWSGLIERIRSTATRVRDVEAQSRERETQLDEIMQRARADIAAAEDRIRAAEAQASQIEATASVRIQAAEQRADAAEERARIAEAWLRRIHETIYSEFAPTEEGER